MASNSFIPVLVELYILMHY